MPVHLSLDIRGKWPREPMFFRRLRVTRVARLANVSGKEAVKAFEKAGWHVIGQVGSHVVMTKPGERVNLSSPQIPVS
jgi:hypothetical protein